MSDEIIAAIEAPRATETLVGHAEAERQIAAAWHSGRFHHAWLLAGPKGIGKATLAWRAAKFILATDRAGADGATLAVGADDAGARRVRAGSHSDCRLVRRSYNMTVSPPRFRAGVAVEDIRALGPFLRQTPAEGGWRVAVIDAADEMNVAAQNALLKMLEEPPAKSVLLLVAHASASLLPTIRSRCRKLAMRELGEPETIDVLAPQLPELHRDDLVLLARLARGSPGRAMALAAAGGAETYRALMAVLATLPKLDQDKALALVDTYAGARAGDTFETFAELYLGWLRRLVHDAALAGDAGADPTGRSGGIDPVETMLNQKLAPLGARRWLTVWEAARDRLAACRGLNLDSHQAALGLFFDLDAAARPT